jgi:non-ribosomal peptide synthetase component F
MPWPMTRCGLLLHRPKNQPAEAWLVFACEMHAGRLVAARELPDRDPAVLARWQEEERHEYSLERPWRQPEPLARAGDAVQLVERARRWAEQQSATGAS